MDVIDETSEALPDVVTRISMWFSGVSVPKPQRPRVSTSAGARTELEWRFPEVETICIHQPQITRISWHFPPLQPLSATEYGTNTAMPSFWTCREGHPLRKLMIRAPKFLEDGTFRDRRKRSTQSLLNRSCL